MTAPMNALPSNYTNNSLYWQYLAQLINQQQQQQAQQQSAAQSIYNTPQPQQLQTNTISPEAQAIMEQQRLQPGERGTGLTPPAGDGKDDGSISFGSKLKNMAKGVGNFFKGMVCDEKGKFSIGQTLKTVAIGAGAVALTVATGGAATPFLIAAGGTMAAAQIGKGAYNAATAKTDAQAEAAWQDIGTGATAMAGTVVGAKGALKASGAAVPKGNFVTSSIKATGECFKIAGKGVYNGGKSAILHPIQSGKNIAGYYKNTMKPNVQNALSYKNYTSAMETKINNKITKIDSQIKALNDELTAGPSASRVTQINTKLAELNNQKTVQTTKLNFNNGKNKGLEAIEQRITEVESRLADPAVTAAEKTRLGAARDQLYEMADIIDSKYKIGVKNSQKVQKDYIDGLKEQLKTATDDAKTNLQQEIKLQESILKGLNKQTKVELAQNNISAAEAKIKGLQLELKKTGLTDVQKEAITSRISKLEKAVSVDKKVLKNANYKIATEQTLPKVGLAYGSAYLAGRGADVQDINPEDFAALQNALLQQELAQQQSQISDPNQMAAQSGVGYPQASQQYNPSLFAMQPPSGTGLKFNDLYQSPFPTTI